MLIDAFDKSNWPYLRNTVRGEEIRIFGHRWGGWIAYSSSWMTQVTYVRSLSCKVVQASTLDLPELTGFMPDLTSCPNFFNGLFQYRIFSRGNQTLGKYLSWLKVQVNFWISDIYILMEMTMSMGMLKINLRSGSDSDSRAFCLLFGEIGVVGQNWTGGR